jgi:hypothetical protein
MVVASMVVASTVGIRITRSAFSVIRAIRPPDETNDLAPNRTEHAF